MALISWQIPALASQIPGVRRQRSWDGINYSSTAQEWPQSSQASASCAKNSPVKRELHVVMLVNPDEVKAVESTTVYPPSQCSEIVLLGRLMYVRVSMCVHTLSAHRATHLAIYINVLYLQNVHLHIWQIITDIVHLCALLCIVCVFIFMVPIWLRLRGCVGMCSMREHVQVGV